VAREVKEDDNVTINSVKGGLALVLAALAAASIASCGGDAETDAPDRLVPGGADPADVAVIEEWVTRLRRGDVEGAAELFAIPSVAQNGPIPIEIEEPAEARLFNASLPCGAILVRAESQEEFTIATFRLTERPGPGSCGPGAGAGVQTAFVIEGGLIVEWRRVLDGLDEPPQRAV
jgi:hypothetical protein